MAAGGKEKWRFDRAALGCQTPSARPSKHLKATPGLAARSVRGLMQVISASKARIRCSDPLPPVQGLRNLSTATLGTTSEARLGCLPSPTPTSGQVGAIGGSRTVTSGGSGIVTPGTGFGPRKALPISLLHPFGIPAARKEPRKALPISLLHPFGIPAARKEFTASPPDRSPYDLTA
jgi:hypothetical protein